MLLKIRSLKPEIIKRIKNKQYTYQELCRIRDAVTAPARSTNTKPLVILFADSAVLVIALCAYMLIKLKGNTTILMCLLMIIAGVTYSMWCNFGAIRFGFNHALKKGYPDLYENLKIRPFFKEYRDKSTFSKHENLITKDEANHGYIEKNLGHFVVEDSFNATNVIVAGQIHGSVHPGDFGYIKTENSNETVTIQVLAIEIHKDEKPMDASEVSDAKCAMKIAGVTDKTQVPAGTQIEIVSRIGQNTVSQIG